MLKFVKQFRKSDRISDKSKKVNVEEPVVDENEININLNLNNNKQKRANFIKSKKFKLLIASIVLVLIAFIILAILLIVIFKIKPGLKESNGINCKPCKQGFKEILLRNKTCYCLQQENESITCKDGENNLECECSSGYEWSEEDKLCVDINECEYFNCESETAKSACLNKNGSFECECKPGFKWSVQYEHCIDINECIAIDNPCTSIANSVCLNTPGSFKCECQSGFSRKPITNECVDINECEVYNTTCNNSTECANTQGAYECCLNETKCFNCGYQYYDPILEQTSRIIGGVEVIPYSWPWLVSIGINYKFNLYIARENKVVSTWYNVSHICGGSLISKNTVLTAAHCVHNLEARIESLNSELSIKPNLYHPDLASILTVYVGIHNQEVDKLKRNQVYKIKQVIIHENFDSRMYLNDIALLILDRNIVKTSKSDWICFDLAAKKQPLIGSILYATGFGSTSELQYYLGSNVLRQVDLELLNFTSCDLVTQFMITNKKSQFCAGYLDGKKDTCAGDSGSPIMYKLNQVWYVIGVVSYGQGCGQSYRPGINTNVNFYKNWIKSKLN